MTADTQGITRDHKALRDSLLPLPKDTELIAFGVCRDNPRLLTLADVDALRAMRLKAGHLVDPTRRTPDWSAGSSPLATTSPSHRQPDTSRACQRPPGIMT